MACPICGGTQRTELGRGWFTCTSERAGPPSNVYDITQPQGQPRPGVTRTCLTTYKEYGEFEEFDEFERPPINIVLPPPDRLRDTGSDDERPGAHRRDVPGRFERLAAFHAPYGGRGALYARVKQTRGAVQAHADRPPPAFSGRLGTVLVGFTVLSCAALLGLLGLLLNLLFGLTPQEAAGQHPIWLVVATVAAAAPGVTLTVWVLSASRRHRRRQRALETELAELERVLGWCGDPACLDHPKP